MTYYPPGKLPPLPPKPPDEPPKPPAFDPLDEPDDDEDEAGDSEPSSRRERASNDPMFAALLALALNLGSGALAPTHADLRYVLTLGLLAVLAVSAWLLGGNLERIEREDPTDLAWGFSFGAILGLPLLLAGGAALETTVSLMFRTEIDGALRVLPPGAVLALLVFVMPLGETLFFRGLLQAARPVWLVGSIASIWSILLFFPMIEVGAYPVVAVIFAAALIMMNMIYSYVRQRNGLAAAWLCQIVVNLLVIFVPFIS